MRQTQTHGHGQQVRGDQRERGGGQGGGSGAHADRDRRCGVDAELSPSACSGDRGLPASGQGRQRAGRPRRLPRARGCLRRARAARLPATHLRGRPRPRERTPPSFCLWASDSPAWGRGLSLQLRPAAAEASPPVSSKRRATAPRAPRRVFRNIPGAGSRPGAPASQTP